MPINFGQFMFRPGPLAQGGMGEGLDSIIQNNQEKARLAQQESQYARTRGDIQRTNSANFARDTANTSYDTSKGQYDKQAKAIADARAAGQSGHHDVARALIPTIRALGGQAEERPDGTFYFKEGGAPSRGAPDFSGTRQRIYEDAPSGPRANPFEPSAVSGASAAALPPPGPAGTPPLTADPPPGAARSMPPPGAAWLPPGIDPGPQPEAPPPPPPPGTQPVETTTQIEGSTQAPPPPAGEQSGQPGSPQVTGPNPFAPPGLDPYVIDPSKVRASNEERLQPFLQGVANAAGTRYRPRIEDINKYVASLGLPPDESIKATEKLYGEIFGIARSELAAEGQAGRLEQTGAHQQAIRDDKLRQFAVARINKLTDNDSLKDTKKKITAGREAMDLIPRAHMNGNSANALIESIYRMKNTGVMTDKDFDRSAKGVQSLWGLIEKGALNTLLHSGGGFDPTTVGDLKELVETAMRSHRDTMKLAASSLINGYRSAPNDIEKEEFNRAIVQFLPEEYLPEEFVEPWMKRAQQGGQVPVVDEADEQATMERMAAEEGGLGVVDVPAGRHPTTPMARGSRVPPKPPRKPPSKKDPKKMTNAEIAEELKRLEEEGNAP